MMRSAIRHAPISTIETNCRLLIAPEKCICHRASPAEPGNDLPGHFLACRQSSYCAQDAVLIDDAKFGASVCRFIRRITGRADLAEDLTQEVFVRVVRALPHYQPRDRDAAWMYRIARNVIHDERRAVARRGRSQREYLPFSVVAQQELRLGLKSALFQLRPLDQKVFLLREVQGLNYAAISHICGISCGAVRNRLRRTRAILRVILLPEICGEARDRD